jgi:hypothetical protein
LSARKRHKIYPLLSAIIAVLFLLGALYETFSPAVQTIQITETTHTFHQKVGQYNYPTIETQVFQGNTTLVSNLTLCCQTSPQANPPIVFIFTESEFQVLQNNQNNPNTSYPGSNPHEASTSLSNYTWNGPTNSETIFISFHVKETSDYYFVVTNTHGENSFTLYLTNEGTEPVLVHPYQYLFQILTLIASLATVCLNVYSYRHDETSS